MSKKTYIGPYQIKSTTETEDGYMKVEYESKEVTEAQTLFSKEVLEAVTTEEESDLTLMREAKCKVVMKKIQELLLEHNICTGEITYLMNLIGNSAHNTERSAIEKMMGEPMEGISFHNLHTILTE